MKMNSLQTCVSVRIHIDSRGVEGGSLCQLLVSGNISRIFVCFSVLIFQIVLALIGIVQVCNLCNNELQD